jgi:opacity protein-like surface antigen
MLFKNRKSTLLKVSYFLLLLLSNIFFHPPISYSSPLLEISGSPYVSLSNFAIIQDPLRLGNTDSTKNQSFRDTDDRIFTKTGYGFATALGWKFDNRLRVELEYAFRIAQFDDRIQENKTKDHFGDFRISSVLLNLAYGFDTKTKFSPYIGVGIGPAFYQINAISPSTGDPQRGKDAGTSFSYQVFLGADYQLSDQLTIGVGYNYFKPSELLFDQTIIAAGGASGGGAGSPTAKTAIRQFRMELRWFFKESNYFK